MNQDGYSYETAGFNGFLSRSIDNLAQSSLSDAGPNSTAIRYDSSQVSGFLGDGFSVGPVRITKQGIIMSDDNGNDVLLIGEEDT